MEKKKGGACGGWGYKPRLMHTISVKKMISVSSSSSGREVFM